MNIHIVATYFRAFRERVWQRKGHYDVNYLLSRRRDWVQDIVQYGERVGANVSLSIANDKPTQLAWVTTHPSMFEGADLHRLIALKEHSRYGEPGGLSFQASEYPLAEKVVLAQIQQTAADVVLLANPFFPSVGFRQAVRRQNISVAVQATQGISDLGLLDATDTVLTVCPRVAERYRAAGLPARVFHYGFNPDILKHVQEGTPANTVSFVGQLGGLHVRRRAFLEALSEAVPLDWYGPASDACDPTSPLTACWRGEAFGLDMYRAIRASRLGINIPPDFAPWLFGMFRIFEVMGLGVPLVLPSQVELDPRFIPGEHVICVDDVDDAVTKIRSLLQNPERARAIGEAGQQLVLSHYGSERAVANLVDILASQAAHKRPARPT
jgi:glycosyltransferase involved in cell wall biosynthesis